MTTPDLATMLEKWNNHILDWALILAAVATMSMALLELLKVIVRARPVFHEKSVRTWTESEKTYDELLMLAVGGGGTANALFDQATNKMMGQIQAAANTALDFPQRYPSLYSFLTAQPGTEAVTRDELIWAQFCERVERGERLDPESSETAAEVSAATRARARLDHFVARRLDAFQTVAEYRWARWNQGISVAGATVFLFFLMYQAGNGLTARTVMASIFGGMIAPLAKDIVSALSDLRARRV
jgi:hypothetical protein